MLPGLFKVLRPPLMVSLSNHRRRSFDRLTMSGCLISATLKRPCWCFQGNRILKVGTAGNPECHRSGAPSIRRTLSKSVNSDWSAAKLPACSSSKIRMRLPCRCFQNRCSTRRYGDMMRLLVMLWPPASGCSMRRTPHGLSRRKPRPLPPVRAIPSK